MFGFANLSELLWGRSNQAYIAFLPLILIFAILFLSLRRTVNINTFWVLLIAISAFLYVAASFFGSLYQHSTFYHDWWFLRSAFLINIAVIYFSYIAAKRDSVNFFKGVKLGFCLIFFATFLGFLIFLTFAIFFPSSYWPEAVGLQYGNVELPIVHTRVARFGAFFKEPSEAAFFLSILCFLFLWEKRFIFAGICLIMGFFTFSNTLPLILIVGCCVYIGIIFYSNAVIPAGGLAVGFVLLGFLLMPEPSEEYVGWVSWAFPRPENIFQVRDVPQHFWVNYVGVQYLRGFNVPLGGGGSFIDILTSEYYYFDQKTTWATGKGIVRFLTDFGFLALPVISVGLAYLHREVVSCKRSDALLMAVVVMCVAFMTIRTGYYNISVWTIAIAVIFYLHPSQRGSLLKAI